MRLEWRTHTSAKSGNRPDENEDICLPENLLAGEYKEFRCSVADGATSTSFSQKWANILAATTVNGLTSSHQSIKPILSRGQTLWNEYLLTLDLPWHALEKTRQGAFSTLLWFKAVQTGYSNATLGMWQALAVGDSCMCQMRDNKIQASFPVLTSGELGNNPVLLSSVESRNDGVWKNGCLRIGQGAFEGGDEFLFMTDALAGWFLSELEKGASPLDEIRNALTERDVAGRQFETLVRKLRAANAIKNDDTTLGYLKIHREAGRGQEQGWS